jgi:hypothetical protein
MFMAAGLRFDSDRYLRSSPFKAISVFRRGEVPPKDNPTREQRPDSGFLVLVSHDEHPQLTEQVVDAMGFLTAHSKELEKLRAAGVEKMLFDFGSHQEHVMQRSQYLPPELLQAMAKHQMGLVFSLSRCLPVEVLMFPLVASISAPGEEADFASPVLNFPVLGGVVEFDVGGPVDFQPA